MTPSIPAFKSIAERLIRHAAEGREDAAAIAGAADHVFQRLRDHLGRLIGVIGFRTLLARTLKMAKPGLPALDRVEVEHDGTLAGLADALAAAGPTEALAAPTALLARFLDLLAAFVGDDLARHLVDEAMRSGFEPEGSVDAERSEQR